jgi:hypothetical protein
MLPNLRFLICGVLFCFLLFAVTGAGVMLPDARTRVGEMPEIGRPMMQQSMMDAPAQAQFYMMTAARRSDELERLREQATSAPTQGEPNLPKPDAVAQPASPEGNTGEAVEVSVQVPGAESGRDDLPSERQVDALAPAESIEPLPIIGRIPLPPRRPALFNGLQRRVRALHARHRTMQLHDTAGQGVVPGQGVIPDQGMTTSQTAPAASGGLEAARRHPLP